MCGSNTKRKQPAREGKDGRKKAEEMAERCREISTQNEVDAVRAFLTAGKMAEMLDRRV